MLPEPDAMTELCPASRPRATTAPGRARSNAAAGAHAAADAAHRSSRCACWCCWWLLGGWELAARHKWIDPFFFSMPSMIGDQLCRVDASKAPSQGPLWMQLGDPGRNGDRLPHRLDRRRHLRHRARPQPAAVGRLLHLHQDRQLDPARGAGPIFIMRSAWAWPRRWRWPS